jgi:uncharacterized protein YhaN
MNKENRDAELKAKWAAIEAKNKKWLKEVEGVVDDTDAGVCLSPQNQKDLNKMMADLAESAADDKDEHDKQPSTP